MASLAENGGAGDKRPGSGKEGAALGKKILLLLSGLVFAFGLVEAGLRVAAWVEDEKRIADWNAVREGRSRAGKRWDSQLGEIIRPSRQSDVIYQLIPELDVQFKHQKLTTNSRGFRSPEVPEAKSAGSFRIVSIGDSVMFGMGVGDGENFVRIVEKVVNATNPARPIEIVNTAVPGYNTAMQVAILESLGLLYQPDLVWIDFVRNDLDLPNFISTSRNYLDLNQSFLCERIMSLFDERNEGFGPLYPAPKIRGMRRFQNDPDLVPPEYRHMVGRAGYRRAMKRLSNLSEKHGFAVVVSRHNHPDEFVTEVAREFGFPVMNGKKAVNEWMRENGVTKYKGSVLTVSTSDPHPSALQHQILGEFYAKFMLESGILR